MTFYEICTKIFVCYPLIASTIALFLCLSTIALFLCLLDFEDKLPIHEKVLYVIFWQLAIMFLPILYLIKKIRLNAIKRHKLEAANKLEEHRHKKELVCSVLNELKLR